MADFISEDDLDTFDGWMTFQGVDPASLTPEELAEWRGLFGEATERRQRAIKVGRMKLRIRPDEYRYAVAVREEADLWLVFWIRRSPRGEFFFFHPHNDSKADLHTSYHLDGTVHTKSHGIAVFPPRQRQPLTGPFRGVECLGAFGGYGPKVLGAICDPADFTAILEVPSGLLGVRSGTIVNDLVEPGCDPLDWPGTEIARSVFVDVNPNIVVRVFS